MNEPLIVNEAGLSLLAWIGIQAVLFVFSLFLRPKVKRPEPGSIEPPDNDPTASINLVWGTCKVQPTLVWLGQSNSRYWEFSWGAGYMYHAGAAFGICWGPVDSLEDIIFDNDKSLLIRQGQPAQYPGTPVTSPTLPLALSAGGTVMKVEAFDLFGDRQEEGGVRGSVRFYFGTEAQTSDAYMNAQILQTQSAYKRLCYAVFANDSFIDGFFNWYWGISPRLKNVHFVVKRCPFQLTGGTSTASPNGKDANPAEVIYDILTDCWWGFRVPASQIDVASFQNVADALHAETLGVSLTAQESTTGADIIEEVLRCIDGVLYTNPITGLLSLRLIRFDYDTGNLLVINGDNGSDFEFSRPTFGELYTGVKVRFTNRERNYSPDTADWQNQATLEISGEENIQEVDLLPITHSGMAQLLAFRAGKAATMPFARARFNVDRIAHDLYRGQPFILDVPEENIGPIVMRVMEIDYGSLDDGRVAISAVEDVFFSGDSPYATPEIPEEPGGVGDIPDMVLWLKPETLVASLSGGDPIALWPDSSGNENHATQATEAFKPELQVELEDFGMQPAARFNATTLGDIKNLMNFPDDAFSALTGAEIFIVLKIDADPPAVDFRSGLHRLGASGANYTHYPFTDGIIYDNFGSTTRKTTVNPDYPLNYTHIYNAISVSGEWTSAINGTQIHTDATNTVSFPTITRIGASQDDDSSIYNLAGHIAEVIMFSRKLEISERAMVNEYLTTKFNITGPPPPLAPDQLPGLLAWHEAAQQPEATNDPVATLVGLGVTDDSQTQTDSAKRPILVELTGAIKAIRFDDSDDSITLAVSSEIAARPSTVHVVYACRTAASSARRLLTGDNTTTHNWLMGPYEAGHKAYVGGMMSAGAVVADEIHVLTLEQPSASNAKLYLDNVLTDNNAGTNVPGVITVGVGPFAEPAHSDVIAIAVFNAIHTDEERGQLVDYLLGLAGL